MIFFFEFEVIVKVIEPKPALRGEEMNGPHKIIQLTGGYRHEASDVDCARALRISREYVFFLFLSLELSLELSIPMPALRGEKVDDGCEIEHKRAVEELGFGWDQGLL